MYYVFSNGRVFYVVDRFMNVIYKFMTLVEAQQVASFLNYQGSINNYLPPMRLNNCPLVNNISNLLPYENYAEKVRNFNLPIQNKNMYLKQDEMTYDEGIKNNPIINQMDNIKEFNNQKVDKNSNDDFWKAKLQELENSLNEKNKQQQEENNLKEREALEAKINKLEEALKNQEHLSDGAANEEKKALKAKIRKLDEDLEDQKTIDFENNQEVEKLRTEIKELRAKKTEIIYRDVDEDPNAFLTTREINNFIQEIEK